MIPPPAWQEHVQKQQYQTLPVPETAAYGKRALAFLTKGYCPQAVGKQVVG